MREFVFKKIGIIDFNRAKEVMQQANKKILTEPLSELLIKHSEKKISIETGIFNKVNREYFCCSTDEDSLSTGELTLQP